jgi:hypothetical protein
LSLIGGVSCSHARKDLEEDDKLWLGDSKWIGDPALSPPLRPFRMALLLRKAHLLTLRRAEEWDEDSPLNGDALEDAIPGDSIRPIAGAYKGGGSAGWETA